MSTMEMHPPICNSRRPCRFIRPALRLLCALVLLGDPAGAWAQAGTGGNNAAEQLDKPYVVLVSFDAFRHDYLDRGLTPHLDSLASAGIRADALIPVYPSKTYPNHYSIATGMYAEHHGLVANSFYDPGLDARYRSGSATVGEGRWYGGEPLWVTAERQGMVSATMFWVGSEALIEGVRPSYWRPFDPGFSYGARIQQVLDWLRLPAARRPHLITLYFEVTDSVGHYFGPDSPEIDNAVTRADSLLGDLLAGIQRLPIAGRVDIVVVSDHGMTPITRRLNLDDYADLAGVVVVPSGPFVSLWFRGDTARMNEVYERLKGSMPHVQVYLRSAIPAAYHLGASPRAGDILVVGDEGTMIGVHGVRSPEKATHGYPPEPSMYGIFVAAGPGVARGGRIPVFENIHVYPFITALLGLTPYPGIDGRASVLRPYLTVPSRR